MMPGRRIALAETAVAAALWTAFLAGSAVWALTMPVYTSLTVRLLDVPATAGLGTTDTLHLAEDVRAFVSGSVRTLPSTWRGEPAFDAAAVHHLEDVRAVMAGGRLATGISALLLALMVAYDVARRRLHELRIGMRAGAFAAVASTAIALAAALLDFDGLFIAFHGLFFRSGTWVFPYDSLIIRLFPERFWMLAGGMWAGLILTGAVVLITAASALRATSRT